MAIRSEIYDNNDLHLEATELRLGLPGCKDDGNQSVSNKRLASNQIHDQDSSSSNYSSVSDARNQDYPPPSK